MLPPARVQLARGPLVWRPILLAFCCGLAACGAEDGTTGQSGGQPPEAPVATASPEEIAHAREAAEKALDDGRIDDAERLATYLAERDRSGSGHELLGRVWLVRATDAQRRGDATAERDARQRAADAYRHAATADPTNAGLQDAAGRVLDAAGLLPDAIAAYTRALALDPSLASALLHRGNAHLRAGDHERARQDAERLERLAPTEPWTHALLAELALTTGDHAAAVSRAAQARTLAPEHLAFRVLHARTLRLAGDAHAAVELLIGLEPAERAERAVTAEIAAGWRALGRHADARDAWANAYRLGPPPARMDAALEAGQSAIDADDLVDSERWLAAAAAERPMNADEDPRIVALRTRLAAARAARAERTGGSP